MITYQTDRTVSQIINAFQNGQKIMLKGHFTIFSCFLQATVINDNNDYYLKDILSNGNLLSLEVEGDYFIGSNQTGGGISA